ncbi:DNA-binding transcriptional regulator YhcF (GntR family) [Kribbella aluminosa]|uniref:DNA-binding transcriptional regulator YhcF (GntR family) n=1 Tax=Kribbella aluminosa TaxID=416017 RepID=A0ABS4UED0_9ACTN|nr:GntR family transcriptional regulator [Kribbella aluminosa]MBP2349988.1 DNA-binding transcriptional regulator YhcF (GntR family) [Kribbella aluminosa]
MTEAPYQVIAAALRRRIEAGELLPGDRVPSTRALTRDFGVAMATATKALQVLQAERLVHASPGVGTVVGPPPRARRTAAADGALDLNRDEVVRMGVAIADTEGLAALSMRRIAAELGVSTMALYRYVGGKDALVVQMVNEVIAEFPLGEIPEYWRDAVAMVARVHWAAYRKHLWLASAISLSRPQLVPRLLPHTDAVLGALRGFELYRLDKGAAMSTMISLFAYVRGIALVMESEAQAEQDTGETADEWVTHQTDQLAAMIAAGNLGAFRELLADGFDYEYDLDQLFEFGLGVFLDGLEARR